MTYFIAESVFWGFFVVMAVLLYQAAVLPGIRLGLRYRTFALRDQLRLLVIAGRVRESDRAFQLLHHQLNYMCVSLNRYDLARLVHSMKTLDQERRNQIAEATQTMEAASDDVKKIYKDSLEICVKALVFNSLLFFIATTVCFLPVLLLKVGAGQLRHAFVSRVREDGKVGFFAPELAAV